VGSYFHDIGKMLKPHYFIENQTGENRHNDLEPALSTLIIIGHVKDGVALAEQYGLPEPIVDFIRQHHGTTLVEYFYRAALRIAEESGTAPPVIEGVPHPLESTFRYPGPKPQTREAAVVMLADAVESASRAMSQPTPASLRKLVRDLSMKRLLDGQFAESGLTLTELHQVEESLVKGLIALYHNRIKYPEAERKAG
jgi:putative nucleotidyltransferase with HDIG domain